MANRSRWRSFDLKVRRSARTRSKRHTSRSRRAFSPTVPSFSPGPARNVTAIVIDSLNTLPEDQVAVRAQVMHNLRALAPNTRVAIYSLGSTFRIVHDFSADLNALRARLAKLPTEYNLQPVPANELVRRQVQEAEHLNTVSQGDSSDTNQDAQADAELQAEWAKARAQMARPEEYFRSSYSCGARTRRSRRSRRSAIISRGFPAAKTWCGSAAEFPS